MIQTYIDKSGRVVQAMRLTGTASSARKVCRWLGISTWCVVPHRDGTYCVKFPDFMHPVFACKGDWVVLSSASIEDRFNCGDGVHTYSDKDFHNLFERV